MARHGSANHSARPVSEIVEFHRSLSSDTKFLGCPFGATGRIPLRLSLNLGEITEKRSLYLASRMIDADELRLSNPSLEGNKVDVEIF
jgi:hypothetical protein